MWNLRSKRSVLKALLAVGAVFFILRLALKYSDLEPQAGELYEGPYLTLETRSPPKEGVVLLEGYGSPRLTPRMWCALESAARAHPHMPVSMVMTSSIIQDNRILHVMEKEHPNIKMIHLDVDSLFKDTVLERWYEEKMWQESNWPKSHFNDILRWLILKHYGGIYLDLDTVVIRSLASLPNCTGLESDKWVAAGALKFTPQHRVIEDVVERIAEHFDGTVWGANGPEVITDVLEHTCGMTLPSADTPLCGDVKVMPKSAFYPIPWWDWQRYVTEDKKLSHDLLNDPSVYLLHVWNLHTRHVPVKLNSNQPYAVAARRHCPLTVVFAGSHM